MPILEFNSLLESSAVVTTILQYLSGAVICNKYRQKKSTGDSSGFPFLCGFLSCSFWLRYGSYTAERSVVLVNGIGAALFLIYALIYFIFTINKNTFSKQFAAIAVVLFGVNILTHNMEDPAEAVKVMGVVCCVVTVCFFAAPLTMLLHVIRKKNSESLPFPLIAMSFLVSLQWLIFGVLISDTFIQIPNFLGCLLSLLQLCLFVIYPPKSFSGQAYKLVDQSVVY